MISTMRFPAALAVLAIATNTPTGAGQCVVPETDVLAATASTVTGVAVDGPLVVLGARFESAAGLHAGSAVAFVETPTGWQYDGLLLPVGLTQRDELGASVAISGHVALVGAPGDDVRDPNAGAAYVFVRDDSSWQERAVLRASDGSQGDGLGSAVALHGDLAIVGAPDDSDGGPVAGSAYVFRATGDAWSEEAKLVAQDGASGDAFGLSVAVEGSVAVVGAPFDDDLGGSSGAAYVFGFDGLDWSQTTKLVADDGGTSDFFGTSVAISGDTIVVGARGDDDGGNGAGAAYIFRFDGLGWNQQEKLVAGDAGAFDEFGRSVSVSGGTVAVGARFHDADGEDSGAVHVFAEMDGAWAEQVVLRASDAQADNRLGEAVSVAGGVAVAGSSRGQGYLLVGLGDCNANGSLDACDVTEGTSRDANENGVPDECEPCLADLDRDGAVGFSDLSILLANFGNASGAGFYDGDLDADGAVGLADLSLLLVAYGTICR